MVKKTFSSLPDILKVVFVLASVLFILRIIGFVSLISALLRSGLFTFLQNSSSFGFSLLGLTVVGIPAIFVMFMINITFFLFLFSMYNHYSWASKFGCIYFIFLIFNSIVPVIIYFFERGDFRIIGGQINLLMALIEIFAYMFMAVELYLNRNYFLSK